jgi:putative methyltransferase (TIGR04325 family)
MADCGSGYDSDLIASVVAMKTERAKNEIQSNVLSLDLPSIRTLAAIGISNFGAHGRVLDFGGEAGHHYLIAKNSSKAPRRYDWRVVETPAMVNATQHLSTEELSSSVSLDDAIRSWDKPPQLLLASGVLMCVPNPVHTLQTLLSLGAEKVVFTRTGFSSDQQTRIIVQRSSLADNGPGVLPDGFKNVAVNYPCTFISRLAFESIVQQCGYSISVRILEDINVWFDGLVGISQYGYVCELNPENHSQQLNQI